MATQLAPAFPGSESPQYLESNPWSQHPNGPEQDTVKPLEDNGINPKWYQRGGILSIMTCGAGLFSDGYLNGVIGPVNTLLRRIYGEDYARSSASRNISSVAFAGTVVGQLAFGYLVDKKSRKAGMLYSALILILGSILSATAYAGSGNIHGMLISLTIYRFFLGVGIGGEYPSGSVACAEAASSQREGTRNRWFVLFTNFCLDLGYVISGILPLAFLAKYSETNLGPVWRWLLGVGAIFPTAIIIFRFRLAENGQFKANALKKTSNVPYSLIFKCYWRPLLVVSAIWFLYDFSAYAFAIYSSVIVDIITNEGHGGSTSLSTVFGWSALILCFYLPGSFVGAFASDKLGCQNTLALGVFLQAITGLIMAIFFAKLKENIGLFVFVYGAFLTFGEFGPGNNCGLLASKSCATAIRGRYYGIAAAVGKVGAFIGSWTFPLIQKRFGGEESITGMQAPFYIASGLALLSGLLALCCMRKLTQAAVQEEDERFRRILEAHGYGPENFGMQGKETQA